jgi:nitroreductase
MADAVNSPAAMFDELARRRTTVRAFLPEPVPRDLVVEVLKVARMAPSTFNTQPWRVHVVAGRAKADLTARILVAHDAANLPAFSPFPPVTPEAQVAFQEDFGRRYYGALGIDRADAAARYRQTGRNFAFFDAPVGLFFTTDKSLTRHSWLDCGMFMQTLMLAAHARGLGTCPQVAFLRYESIIAEQLGLGETEAVVCGMSLGWPDGEAPVNHLNMPRQEVEQLAQWHGFDG